MSALPGTATASSSALSALSLVADDLRGKIGMVGGLGRVERHGGRMEGWMWKGGAISVVRKLLTWKRGLRQRLHRLTHLSAS